MYYIYMYMYICIYMYIYIQLLAAVQAVCEEDSLELSENWTDKVLQLKQVLDLRHGVMMVGPSNTGKFIQINVCY
jgi:polynucleotide 5'-kinase involved in rRNA processing